MKSQRRSLGSKRSTTDAEYAARRARYEAAHLIRRCANASPLREHASALVRNALTSDGARVRCDDFAAQRRGLVAEMTALDGRDAGGERPIDAYLRRLAQGMESEAALAELAGPGGGAAGGGDPVFEDTPIDDKLPLIAEAKRVLQRVASAAFDVFQVITDVRDGVVLVRPLADPRVALYGFGGQADAIEVAVDDMTLPSAGGLIAGTLMPAEPPCPQSARAAAARNLAMARFTTASLVFRPADRQAVRTICAVHCDSDVATLRAALFALYVSLEVANDHEEDLDALASMDGGSLVALWPCAQLLRCPDREALIDALFDHLCDEMESIADCGAFLLTAGKNHVQIDLVFDDGEIWLRGDRDGVEHYAACLRSLPGVELTPVDVLASVQDIDALHASLVLDEPS